MLLDLLLSTQRDSHPLFASRSTCKYERAAVAQQFQCIVKIKMGKSSQRLQMYVNKNIKHLGIGRRSVQRCCVALLNHIDCKISHAKCECRWHVARLINRKWHWNAVKAKIEDDELQFSHDSSVLFYVNRLATQNTQTLSNVLANLNDFWNWSNGKRVQIFGILYVWDCRGSTYTYDDVATTAIL